MSSNGTIEAYFRPKEIKEAVKTRAATQGAVYLAGGTQVNRAPLDSPRPPAVIDIRNVVPSGISMEGTDLVIGAMTCLQDLADSELASPPLREAAGFIPTRNIRNQATVGGNIAAGRPDSYLLPVFIALAAVARTTEGNVTVQEYVSEGHEDLILDVHIPAPVGACIVCKESRSHIALPVVSAAVSLTEDDDRGITGACIAVGCVGPKVIRLTEVEEALVNGRFNDDSDKLALEKAITDAVSPRTDILGSTDFKKHVNGVVIADAIMRCREALR